MCQTNSSCFCGCSTHGNSCFSTFSTKRKIEKLEKYLKCLDEKKRDIEEAISEMKEGR